MTDWRQQVDLQAQAPAKLNLFLHILGRRADGYHDLQTAFHFIDLYDDLGFRLRDDAQINLCTDAGPIAWQDNLIYRAATLLQTHSDVPLGVDIYLDKRIPMGGGLGGGSSNAATTLCALNKLWQLKLPQDTLLSLGRTLGADVPVFIFAHAAWAEGIGEQLTRIILPPVWYVVLFPGDEVPTSQIFNATELTRDTPPSTMCPLLQVAADAQHYTIFGRNDCEAIVAHQYPAVAKALSVLNQYASARLTGTGASVYAAFLQRQTAQAAYADLASQFDGCVVQGLNVSPLAQLRV